MCSYPKGLNTQQQFITDVGPGARSISHFTLAPTVGKQITASEGHPWPPPKGSRGDIGGNFSTTKTYVEQADKIPTVSMSKRFSFSWGYNDHYYSGPLLPLDPATIPQSPFPPASSSSDATLDVLGAQAVARCKPTNSVADISVALGELWRDGLPSLVGSTFWKNRAKPAKAAGSEYLNAEFGWLPLVADIRKFAKAVRDADAIWSQYVRDSGRVVRRRYDFPSTTEVTRSVYATGRYPAGPSTAFNVAPSGSIIRVREKTQRRWFSGAFTYHLPSELDFGGSLANNAARADKLFGIAPTPDVLWNLAPWSWAVDWFSSTGDVISNLTDYAVDGLVLVYGYLMEHTIVKDTYTLPAAGLNPGVHVTPLTFVTETKLRRKANPFGFGVLWQDLSPRQGAIAAALGISRDRKRSQ